MEKMIPDKETISVELKSDRNCLPDSEILETVVALSNTDGGDLYLGVEDDGLVTGIHPKHQDITRLSAFIANHTIPPVSTRVEMLSDPKPVIRISVPKSMSGIIATISGKVLRRRSKADGSPESVPMYPAEQASRLSDLRVVDHSSILITEATLDDFDPLELVRLRNAIRSYDGEKNLLELSDLELYQALGFCRDYAGTPVPTLTGLLILGYTESIKKYIPTHSISFQALSGTRVRVNDDFVLPILAAIEKLTVYLEAWNHDNEIEIGMYRISAPDFDKRAVREAVVNAFSHRDYTRLGRIRIAVSDEGLTIASPGGFIEGVSLKNLLTVEPHGRNPGLANALKRIGLAERTGRGIDRIFEGSLKYGRMLPDFNYTTDVNVSLLLPRSKADTQMTRIVADEQKRFGRSLSVYALMVLNALRSAPRSTARALAELTNLSETVVRTELEMFIEDGLLETSGTGERQIFSLSDKAYRREGNQPQVSPAQQKEAILAIAKSKEYITKADVVSLLSTSAQQSYLLLRKLTNEGKLSLQGKGRNAKYKWVED